MDDILKENWRSIVAYAANRQWGKDDVQNLEKELKLAKSLQDTLYYGSKNDNFIEDALKTTNKLAEACNLVLADEKKHEVAESLFKCYVLAASCDSKAWSGGEKPYKLTEAVSNADDALGLCSKEFLQTSAGYSISDIAGLAFVGDEKTANAFLNLNKTFLQKGMMNNGVLSGKCSISPDWYEAMEKIALRYPSLASDCIRQVRAFATCDDNRISAMNNGSTFLGVVLNDERFSKTDKLLAKSAKNELDNEHFHEYGFIPNEKNTKEDWLKHIKFMETGEYETVPNQNVSKDNQFDRMEKEYSKSSHKDKRWEEYTKSNNYEYHTIDNDFGYGM